MSLTCKYEACGILNLSYCFEYRIIINLFREYFWTATVHYIPIYVRLLAYICRFFEFRIEAQLLIQLARHLPILQNLLVSVRQPFDFFNTYSLGSENRILK